MTMKKRTNRLFRLAAALLTVALLAGCSGAGSRTDEKTESTAAVESEQTSEAREESMEPVSQDVTEHELHHVSLTVENYGTIQLELDATAAPQTVANFLKLAGDGFYDGLTFHRIIDGFMIQGGRPRSIDDVPERIQGEFAANGIENPISHVTGVISMARANEYDSASSQFFITVGDSEYLDGQYAAFGHVTEGMEIAEQIAKDAKPIDNNGTIPEEEQPVITSITVLD